jgi:hypothetical protein
MALQVAGKEVLHASAIRTTSGVVALCGASGTGKSTIAYGLSLRGYSLWADDAVVFDSTEACVRSVPLPFRIRLRSAAASFFGYSSRAEHAPWRWEGAELVERDPARLAALWLLKRESDIGEGQVQTRKLSSIEAFLAALEHAACYSLRDVERKQRMVRHYARLTDRVPFVEIRFAPELGRLSTLLDAMESCIQTGLTERAEA